MATTPQPTSPAASNRYVCIHGHFYQPPRENPWLEVVEVQDSAAPFHDWNERITSECYAPNGASRVKNKREQIVRILNNYARMSFNFGPTLLSWLADNAPRTYRMILDADRASARRFSGHGSAVAQVYNHIIMPLASQRDARTQIRWGIADFMHRFGRKPEGMWLAETAVNREVLDLLAQEGIKFTILAPSQCARVRPLQAAGEAAAGLSSRSEAALSSRSEAERSASAATTNADSSASLRNDKASRVTANPSPDSPNPSPAAATPSPAAPNPSLDTPAPSHVPPAAWQETPNASVDPTHPYLVQLDEGRSISIFFYDGPVSRAIAFEGMLNSGEAFASRILGTLAANPEQPQLAHVATDGESYGHHHKHGEMALSYALHYIEERGLATVTNYGEFLEKFPPQYEAEVNENTSWSCAHGIERWRADCGCNGGKAGWNQRWRAPLREALDYLRDATAPLAEEIAAPLLIDLWEARDAYIHVVLDRTPANIERFLAQHATHTLSAEERVRVFELMELERHTQLMYTSCGWFFDEVSGIETVQIIAYAGRVLQLSAKLFGAAGEALEAEFLALLELAESNVQEIGNGAEVYRRHVVPSRVTLEHVGAHYAISSIFRAYRDHGSLFCYDLHRESYEVFTSGRGRVAQGRARLRSRITEETEDVCFAVLHLGDQNLSAAVKRYTPADAESWEVFTEAARQSIRRANLPEFIRLIDHYFEGTLYSLTSLFSDEQHRILSSILNQTLSEVEGSLMRIYEEHATLLHFLAESNVTAPPALAVAAGFAINARLRKALEAEAYDTNQVAGLLARAHDDGVRLDDELLRYTADRRMKQAMVRLEGAAAESNALAVLADAVAIAESLNTLPMDVNLWQAQNIWNDLLRRSDAGYHSREWREGFSRLGTALNINVEELVIDENVRTF
jgi:alpha-amylase/alpha-mannosidase (GH57 family)